jgi:hypothetical protein
MIGKSTKEIFKAVVRLCEKGDKRNSDFIWIVFEDDYDIPEELHTGSLRLTAQASKDIAQMLLHFNRGRYSIVIVTFCWVSFIEYCDKYDLEDSLQSRASWSVWYSKRHLFTPDQSYEYCGYSSIMKWL